MHLGKETSANRRDATMRIAFLLLSLGFLFHNVCPGESSTGEDKALKTVNSSISNETQVVTTRKTPTEISNPVHPSVKTNPSTANTVSPLTSKTSAAAPIAAPSKTAIPVDQKATAQALTAPTAATAAAAAPTVTASTAATVAITATTGTTANNGGTPETTVTSKMSRTETPATATGNSHHVDTITTTKVSIDATGGQQSVIHSTVPSKMSTGDTGKPTVAVKRNEETAPGAPEPNQNPVTTDTPRSQTEAGPPVPEIITATMSPQTTNSTSTSTSTSTSNTSNIPAIPPTTTTTITTTTTTTTTTEPKLKVFQYSLKSTYVFQTEKEKELAEVCKRLMVNFREGNCTLKWRSRNDTSTQKVQFVCGEVHGKVDTSITTQYYEEISKKATDNKTLIAILASCGALLIMIVILAVCASHHRKPYNENQQHLTEEMHTVENGYHDNPTLDVMEVQPEMQEKKVALNGEFNDSWIVPIDNLLKDDIPDEEDTHL